MKTMSFGENPVTSFEKPLHELTQAEVQSLPGQKKMEYLKSLQVKHRKLEVIGKDLGGLLSQYNETNILAVIGATGVGKTTFSKRLIASLIEKLQQMDTTPQSSIPVIYIPTPANGDKSFSWAAFYEKILRHAQEVAIEKKIANIVDDNKFTIQPRRYRNLTALRDALESMLKHRKVRVLVIDEAYHLLRHGNYSAVMDTLKSLTDQTCVKMILLGSYDLFDLVSEYGQVARRAEILHFERYQKDHKVDAADFRRIIRKLQDRWPCEDTPQFEAIHQELMEASLGCVGLLKAILLEALQLQIDAKDERWDPRFLAKAAKSMKLLQIIRQEIEDGEHKVKGATYGESYFSGKLLDDVINKMKREAIDA